MIAKMKKQILIFFAFLSISVFAVVLFSLNQAKRIEKEILKSVLPKTTPVQPGAYSLPSRELTPARLQDYGMIIIDSTNRPKIQQDWDKLLAERIEDLKSNISPQVWSEIQESIKENPQKTQEKLKKIDRYIKECEETLKGDPNNRDTRERLERLMILKGISKFLPES